MGAAKIATGHNADDVAETVLLNIIRGDVPRWVGGVGWGGVGCWLRLALASAGWDPPTLKHSLQV